MILLRIAGFSLSLGCQSVRVLPYPGQGWDDVAMLFPLDAVVPPADGVSPLAVILLLVAGVMVVFFLIVQLRRILRRRNPKRGDQ